MGDKKVNTKLQVRYDTWDNWKVESAAGKGALYVPLAGEICAVKIDKTPSGDTGASTSVPEAMFKIGDGTNTFKALEWASAKAADVYSWAKGEKLPYAVTNSPSTLTGDGVYLSDVANSTNGGLSFTKKDNMVTTDSEQTLIAKKTLSVQDEQEKTEKDMIVLHLDSGDTQQTPTADLMKLGMSVSDTSDSGESYGYATLHSEDTGSCSDLTISSDKFTYVGVNRNSGTYKYKFPFNKLGSTGTAGDNTGQVKTLLTDEDILTGDIASNNTSAKLVRSQQVANYVAAKLEGKSVAYVIKTTGSYSTGVKNAYFNVAVDNTQSQVLIAQNPAFTITTINNATIILASLHVGDVIYTEEADVKDWFYAGLYTTGGVTNYLFCQISADKPVLSNYVTITGEQKITGEKTFAADTKWVSDVTSTAGTVAIDASDGAITADSLTVNNITPYGGPSPSVGTTTVPFRGACAESFFGEAFRARDDLTDTANQTSYKNGKISYTNNSTTYALTLPSATGTLALTSYFPQGLFIKNEASTGSGSEVDLEWNNKKVTLTSVDSGNNASTDYIKLRADTTSDPNIAAVSIGVGDKVLTEEDTIVLYGGSATDVI